MALLPKMKRINLEDYKDAPEWFQRLAYWLNTFFESINIALTNNLTFEQNMLAQVRSFEVKAGASAALCTASFKLTMKRKPMALFLGRAKIKGDDQTPIGAAVHLDWRYEEGMVYVTAITGLTNGTTYEFQVILV